MNVVIVGGGIIGQCIAFYVAQNKNIKIQHLYPASESGLGTSAAAAMLNSIAEVDAYSLASEHSRALFECSLHATAEWQNFLQVLSEANPSQSFHNGISEFGMGEVQTESGGGTYVLHNTVSSDLDYENFQAIKSVAKEYELEVEECQPSVISGYKPEARSRATESLHIRSEGWLNPNHIISAIATTLAEQENYSRIDGYVDRLEIQSGRILSVTTREGKELGADYVVLANGVFLNDLVTRSNAREIIPHYVYSGVGCAIEVAADFSDIRNCIRTPNRGGACGLYVVPYGGHEGNNHHYIIGASNYISLAPGFRPRAISVAHLLQAAADEINQEFYRAEILNLKVGNRPLTFDQYPLIGQTFCDNLLMANGTRRDGFHMAPVIASFIRNAIESKEDPLFDFFSPMRKPIIDISYENGIQQNVANLISEAFQHGYKPATVRGYEQFHSSITREVEDTHEKFCKSEYGIPPLMYKLAKGGLINDPR